MLGRKTNSLVFPRLEHIKEVKFSRGPKNDSHLYELDWTPVDNLKSTLGSLPDKYDKLIKGLRFAISGNYLKGIHHFSNLALQERNRSWGYDTCIRDNLQIVNGSSVETALMLLADCAYDEVNNYWYPHGKGKFFLKPLMVYKFWAFQTGRGIVRRKSGIDSKLESAFKNQNFSIFEKTMAKDISQSLNNLEDAWQAHYSPIGETECCEGQVVASTKKDELNWEIDKVKESYRYLVEFFGESHSEVITLKEKYDFL